MSITESTSTRLPTDAEQGPVSFAQEQLWFIDQLAPGETTYNIRLALRLRGPLDVEVLRRSLTLVVARHASLRATFHAEDGSPYQVISPPGQVRLPVVDISEELAASIGPGVPSDPADLDKAIVDILMARTGQPFDLEAGPMYRMTLFRVGDQDHVFCQEFHHIVTDGWSSGILNSELSTAYQSLIDGAEPHLPEAQTSYLDYARWQRDRLRGDALDEELVYWENRLAQLPVLELPTDRSRLATSTRRGDTTSRVLPDGLFQACSALAQTRGASPFMVLATALAAVLSRYTGQEDFPIGMPMLGRPEPELEDVVGMFINMVVLRSDLSGDPTFGELLDRAADANLDIYDHQDVPFHYIVDRVQPVRDPGRNPLFQVSTQILGGKTSGTNLPLPGIHTEYVLIPSGTSQFDLTVNFLQADQSLTMATEFSADLFDPWRVQALLSHVETVLSAATADPSLRLSQLPLLPAAERDELLAVGRGEVVTYADDPLHVALAKIAAATPDAVAVVCDGVELTYREFDRRADRLARYLRSLGLEHGQVVSVVLDRQLDAYITMLGVLKAGGAFSMLDPKHPASRLDFMIRDTGARIVITRSNLADRLPESTGWTRILTDQDWDTIEAMPADEPLAEWATPESLAYVLYTSGSTGTPKGVMIPHRGVSFFADGYRRTCGFTASDRLLQLPALHFDMSQGEFWTAFLVGATVVAPTPEEGTSPEALTALMRDQRVTYAGLPPAMLSVLPPEPFPHLKTIMGGAEVLPPELVNAWNLPGRTFINLYGPTEAAIACTYYVCEHKTWQSPPPIGRPQVNRQMYVVDANFNLVPKGVAGELLIGGEDGGLAYGYLNQAEMTAEKFVTDPVRPDRLVYRSGDLVRWNADLQIEFLGRIDNQVKLRGLRIELGEIESALQSHPTVSRAVVLMRPDRHGDNRLIGYVTANSGAEPSPDGLRAHLGELLPEYMIPTAWMVLDEFPLSSGWKINRKALPEPAEPDRTELDFIAPRTPTETTIATIIAEVLSLPRVGAEDSFFAIGGNSLQAMRTISRINKAFGIKVGIRLLYGTATVSSISSAVDGMATPTG